MAVLCVSLLLLGFSAPSWGMTRGQKVSLTVRSLEWSYDAVLRLGRAVVRVQNLGGQRVPSPRVAVVLLDSLGNQLSSAWGRPEGAYLPARSVGEVVLTLKSRLIPSGVRVMLLDESCGACGK
ncbi:hypothetical protein TheveDRAFT_1192 [Thermanaerovibrio velox DSM 12556]|uniref:Uncharacterized protein n=1 Tax=Thermanaerovibrio velox DSM 12556 TaxID=926567 RepID=H0USM7_9BACT|nr:hypothetical protein [Thermanaerovibrio velox]EHM10316.1 hypothetical protein TheveDRAFT_1192 [Thermanaerovibrio velox DSM 12556]